MLKKLVIALVLLACLAGVAVAGFVWKLDAIIQSQKPLIESTASSALGTSVELGNISVNLLPVARLEIKDSVVGRSKSNQGISIADLVLEIDPLPLFSKKLIIKNLVVTDPQLTIRRNETGIAIDGLSKELQTSKDTADQEVAASSSGNTEQGTPGLDISLEQCTLNNARIELHGLTKDPLLLSRINLNSSLVLAKGLISLPTTTFSALLPGGLPLKGSMTNLVFDSSKQLLTFPDVIIRPGASRIGVNGSLITTNSSGDITNTDTTLSLESIAPLLGVFVPTLKDLRLDGDVTLTGTTKIRENSAPVTNQLVTLKNIDIALNTLTVADLNGAVNLEATASNQELQSESLSFVFNGLPVVSTALKLQNSPQQADIDALKLSVFDGSIETKGILSHNLEKSFRADTQVANLNLAKLFDYLKQKLPLVGTLNSLSSRASGTLNGKVLNSLKSSGEFHLVDAALKGINLPGAVLQQVKELPFIEGSLLGQLPPAERAGLERPDTAISSMSAIYTLAGQVVNLKNLKVSGEFFEIIGDGSSTITGEVDFRTEIMFTPGLSSALTSKIKELRYLLGADGRLRFPLIIKGKAPKLTVAPQLDKLLKNAAREAIKDKAGQVLDKLIGVPSDNSQRSPGKDALKGLGGILGF